MMKPIRILYFNGGLMDRGGISTFMMSYYRNMNKNLIHIDFIVHGNKKGIHDEEIRERGGIVYNIPIKSKNYFKNVKAIKKIYKEGSYDIVHAHMDAMSIVPLRIAKKYGIKIRIAHSHNTQHLTNNYLKFIANEIARKNITKVATHLFACSKPAAEWLFGNKYIYNNSVYYIKNAIDLEKFKFNEVERNRIRKELNIENAFVIGNVARFDYQKNHMFLIEVFKQTIKSIPNAKLVLVGDGHLKEKITNKVEKLQMSDKVIFTGIREDVNKVMNAFDVFCLPSLFEGLGIVLIEAQVNGLNCVVSNTVPEETNIREGNNFIGLKESLENWVYFLTLNENNKQSRLTDKTKFIHAGYSIRNEAKKLQDLYIKLWKERYESINN